MTSPVLTLVSICCCPSQPFLTLCPRPDGVIAFECMKKLKQKYKNSTPLWIKKGVCIRPLCEVRPCTTDCCIIGIMLILHPPYPLLVLTIHPLCKVWVRVKCVGKKGSELQCWTEKAAVNYKNVCQWGGCSSHGGTAADRAPDNNYCQAAAALG